MPILTNDQIEQVFAEIKTDKRVQGILLTGSYVYGKPNDESDLDVRCVTSDGSNWAEIKRMRFGVPIEVFFNPPDKVREFMQGSVNNEHGDCIHFWANGKIIYDPNGIVKELQNEAKSLWKQGPPSGRKWMWRDAKHKDHAKRKWS